MAEGWKPGLPPREEIPCEGMLTDGSHCTRLATKNSYYCAPCREAKKRENQGYKYAPVGMEHWKGFIEREDPLSFYEEMQALRGVLAQVLETSNKGGLDNVVVKSIVQLSENIRRGVVTMAEAEVAKKRSFTEEQGMKLVQAVVKCISENVEDGALRAKMIGQLYGDIFGNPEYSGLQQIESGQRGGSAASGQDVPEDSRRGTQ